MHLGRQFNSFAVDVLAIDLHQTVAGHNAAVARSRTFHERLSHDSAIYTRWSRQGSCTGTQLPPEQTGEKQILRLPLKAGRPEHEQQMTGRKARKKGGHEREASDVCHPV